MVYWIKKFARILSMVSLFVVFFVSLNPDDPLGVTSLSLALCKGAAAAVLFWFLGFVIGDILFKGITEDLGEEERDDLEGGLVQRVHETRSKTAFKPLNSAKSEPAVSAKHRSKST